MPDPVTATPAATPAPAAPAVPATPAAQPAPAIAAVPRDPSTGRFTKDGMASVFGGEPVPATPAPVATPEATAAAPTAATPAVPDSDLAALEAYLAAQPEAPPAPTPPVQVQQPPASPEVAQLGEWAANPQIAAEAVQATKQHIALNNALNRGDVQGALAMFHPNVIEAFVEHLYQQRKDQWAQRYTNEAQGITQDPRVAQLERNYAALQQAFEQKQQAEQQQRQQYLTQRQQQERAGALSRYVDGLFESVKLKDSPDRQFLEGPLFTSMTPQQRANIAAGRFGDLGAKFRELYPQFKTRWQPAAPQPTTASTQLMASPSGTGSTPGASAPTVVDGKRTLDFWGGLRKLTKTGS